MAAHLRPLGRMRCDETPCDRAATAQLFNTYNATLGKFCRKHGKRRLEKQLEAERDYRLPIGSTFTAVPAGGERFLPRCPHGVFILDDGTGCRTCDEKR